MGQQRRSRTRLHPENARSRTQLAREGNCGRSSEACNLILIDHHRTVDEWLGLFEVLILGRPPALTEETLSAVRQDLAEGMPVAAVARKYDVPRTTLIGHLGRSARNG